MIEHRGSFSILRIGESHILFQFDKDMDCWNLEEPASFEPDQRDSLIREFVKTVVGNGQKVVYGPLTDHTGYEVLEELEKKGYFDLAAIRYDPALHTVVRSRHEIGIEHLPRFEIFASLERGGVKINRILLDRVGSNGAWDIEMPGVMVYLIGNKKM